jgi:hypothetical protein
MNRISRASVVLWCKCFWYPLVCACFFAAPRLRAGDDAVEQRLNEVYTQLMHTVRAAEKEALKQGELDWLQRRARFSSGDPRWTELTEERIRALEARQ